MNKNNDNDDNEEEESLNLQEFLDKPFFDPNEYDDENNDSPRLLGWFANLVKSDYELAETLYVGAIFAVLLVVSQELLRMQMNGDNYVPFLRGGAGGKLF